MTTGRTASAHAPVDEHGGSADRDAATIPPNARSSTSHWGPSHRPASAAGGKGSVESARKHEGLEQLHSRTVAEARGLLKQTHKDAGSMLAELRELVSVRYRDFIDTADTISEMGDSAEKIISTAGQLGESCTTLVSGTWKATGMKGAKASSAAARDLLKVVHAPSNIADSLERNTILPAATDLLLARERYRELQKSADPELKKWLAVPFVGLSVRALQSADIFKSVVRAAEIALQGEHPGEKASTSITLADSMATVILLKGLSMRDALDTFLEARSSCVRVLCDELGRSKTVASAAGRALSAGAQASEEHTAQQDAASESRLDLMRRACSTVVISAAAALQLFCNSGTASAQDATKEAVLVAQLRELMVEHLRGDSIKALPENHCTEASRDWVQAMAAKVRVSAGTALHAVRSGAVLAEVEQQLQTYVASLEADTPWCSALWQGSLWALLFEQAFTSRSSELVAAHLTAIRRELEPLLAQELNAMEVEAKEDGFGAAASAAVGLEEVLRARRPQGYSAERGDVIETRPWDSQCNRLAAEFLTQLHAALADCARLVIPGSAGDARAALLSSLTLECASALAALLGSTAARQHARLKTVMGAGAFDQQTPDVAGVMEGAAPRESCVEQALYVAQCASTVRRFLPALIATLPAARSDKAEEVFEHELDEAIHAGFSVWVRWTAFHVCGRFETAVRGLGDVVVNPTRLWEEMQVQVETEGGEVRNERVRVPSVMLPHAYALILDACVAIQRVYSPPLQPGTVDAMVACLASSVADAFDAISESVLTASEPLCMQLILELGVLADLLGAARSASPLAQRFSKLRARLVSKVDPIDWDFQAPLLTASQTRALQRSSMIFGALASRRRSRGSVQVSQAPLPKPLNLLPLATPTCRFGYLPAVEAWAAAADKEAEAVVDVDGKGAQAEQGAGPALMDMDALRGDVQAHLGRFSSFLGQQVKGWT